MSRQFRYRVTALGLCGFVLGAPLLAGGAASAAGPDAGFPKPIMVAPSVPAEEPDPDPDLEFPGDSAAVILSTPPAKKSVVRKSATKRSPARVSAGSPRKGAKVTASRPARTAKKEPRREPQRSAGPRPVTSTPAVSGDGVGARLKLKVKPKPFVSTPDETPVLTGMPPGGRRAVLPGPSAAPLGETDYVAALGLEPETTGPSATVPVAPAASVGRLPDERPVGLLAMTAVVCVLGVATAAIRAIVSQRASRANMA